MPPKKIAVDGVGGVKVSNDKELDKWLIIKEIDGLVGSEGCEVGGFESLVDDGKYTLTMASKVIKVVYNNGLHQHRLSNKTGYQNMLTRLSVAERLHVVCK
jgi:hypothetical protein